MLQIWQKTVVYGAFIALSAQFAPISAVAKSIDHRISHYTHTGYGFSRSGGRHYASRYGSRYAMGAARVIQCVAFAKQDAGIEIAGNARDWWNNAAGTYQRGRRPETGSVLSFMANGRMPLGHVAVVSDVEDSRTIHIDQSHWNSGGISRDIEVKDVSENNDWTAVRVQLGRGEAFGSIYPTHGFIYPRADNGVIEEASERAPMPVLDPAPADLRRAYSHHHHVDEAASVEVAEMPTATRGLDLSVDGIASDAPDRAFK
jgi:surface antigen